jgi:DNA replication protein DnaC
MARPPARTRDNAASAETLRARARTERLRHNASVEDVDYHAARGLERAMFLKLASCDFIRERRNLLITGPTEPAS